MEFITVINSSFIENVANARTISHAAQPSNAQIYSLSKKGDDDVWQCV